MTETSGDVAARGLDQAIDELRQWIIEGDYRSPVPLSNALGNVYTLEGSSKRELGKKKYYSIRDDDPPGQTVAGIVFARARFTHHDALASSITPALIIARPPLRGQLLCCVAWYSMESRTGRRSLGSRVSAPSLSNHFHVAFRPGAWSPSRSRERNTAPLSFLS